MHPGIANNTRKTDPDGRSSQMAGVGNQCVAIQPGREQLLAISYAVLLAHGVQPRRPPGLVQGFHDECRHAGLELIGMCLEPAMIGLHKGKGEGIQGFAGSQPYKAALPGVYVRFRSEERRGGKEGVGTSSSRWWP